uniref:Vacuolar protein-sorting-associated protein 36 n=1 Tax=Leersia perrieri TaxID=77586 RepID=A0A0D9V714_9ORYZ
MSAAASAAAGDWLPAAEVTESGRPVLTAGEVERHLVAQADLEPEESPRLSPLRGRLLVLTSHRLILLHDATRSARAIPLAAVVHAYPPHRRHGNNPLRSIFSSSSSSSSSSSHHPRVRLQISLPPARSEVVAVVVTGKGDAADVFYGRLLEAVRARAWEMVAVSAAAATTAPGGGGSLGAQGAAPVVEDLAIRMPVVGVSGILRMEQEAWESAGQNLQDAFQDLNALMSKAKEMMELAEKMRQKLLTNSSAQSNSNDEEMGSKQDMQDWLLSVGIVSPVTKETAGALYHQQLSRQLADYIRTPLEKAGGMMALVDVYCLYNRARGTELISPEDLLQACSLWEKFDVPVMLRKFDSGVKVIQTKTHSDDEVFARISSLAQKEDALHKGISPSDAAFTLGIAPALAKEHLLNAESIGILCRDVSPDGLRFYINLFNEIDRQNIYLAKTHGIYHTWISVTPASSQ